MSAADGPVADAEADVLFADFLPERAVVLAVSGGPDSTALLFLAARWRDRHGRAPRLVAVTVDHGLRPQSQHESADVQELARRLEVEHHIVRWSGEKPATGLQQAARAARYRLLHAAAQRVKARRVVTAHTRDDQAETVLFRMARGSGLSGLAGMAREVPLAQLQSTEWRPAPPAEPIGAFTDARTGGEACGSHDHEGADGVMLVRPLLDVPKTRLIATLDAAGVGYANDPSNVDPRFTRARLRKLLPALAEEGLTPHRLTELARRVRRSEAALEAIVSWTENRCALESTPNSVMIPREMWHDMPAEIVLRLLGRAIAATGDEGPVELRKLESLNDAVVAALEAEAPRFRRTLAGAVVSLRNHCVVIERAPQRRSRGL